MRAYLVRIGVDQAYGAWNAPMAPETNEFAYVPIPESRPMRPELATPYTLVEAALSRFAHQYPASRQRHVRLPVSLASANMHLDPDFENLTYGDSGTLRGKELTDLNHDDFIVFYSGLRPVADCEHRLVYALVGFYHVAESVRAQSVPERRWPENAHTRCVDLAGSDVIVRARPGSSGRLRRCIPIGEFRDRAYRVQSEILSKWGGLSGLDPVHARCARTRSWPPSAREAL